MAEEDGSIRSLYVKLQAIVPDIAALKAFDREIEIAKAGMDGLKLSNDAEARGLLALKKEMAAAAEEAKRLAAAEKALAVAQNDQIKALATADKSFQAAQRSATSAAVAAEKERTAALKQQWKETIQANEQLAAEEAKRGALISGLVAGGAGQFSSGLNDLIGMFEAGAVAAAGFGVAMVGLTLATANYGAEVDLAARKTGESVKSYQELKYAADQTNTPLATLDAGLRKLQVTAGEAANGNKAAGKIFARLGLSPTDAQGALKTADQLLDGVSARLKTIGSDTEKIDLIGKLFGTRSGAQLLPLLEDLQKFRGEADKGIMSDKDVATSLAFNQSLKGLEFTLMSFRNTLGTALMPLLSEVITAFRDWLETNRQLIDFKIHTFAAELTKDLERVGEAIKGVNATVQLIGGWNVVFAGFAAGVSAFVAGGVLMDLAKMVWGVAAAVQGLTVAFDAMDVAIGIGEGEVLWPLAVVIGGIALNLAVFAAEWAAVIGTISATYLVLEDVYGFFNGWDTILGRITNRLSGSTDPTLRAFGQTILAVRNQIDALVDSPIWTLIADTFTAGMIELGNAAHYVWTQFKNIADLMGGPAWRLLGSALGTFAAGENAGAGLQRQQNAGIQNSYRAGTTTTVSVGGVTVQLHGSNLSTPTGIEQAVEAAMHKWSRGVIDANRGY